MIQARQKLHKPSSIWLERIITIAYNARMEEKLAKRLIRETFIYDDAFFTYRDFFGNQPLYENYMSRIQLIRRREKCLDEMSERKKSQQSGVEVLLHKHSAVKSEEKMKFKKITR
ncbi:hypothetical protein NGRA_2032 [Nosema granulosis]|uniref:Uncharacterized protein n=1 Tax=Nosema granulosis TaxID=83296 RepID=A0A9P6KYT9_9MICR|nr:hypothetical protein NGRA_2032 [Nosema granulosis]